MALNKKALIAAALLFASPVSAETVAPDCSVTWDYVEPMPAWVDGFRLYAGDVRVWEGVGRTVACNQFNPPIQEGVINLTATAYNAVDESARSNEVTFYYVETAPDAPQVLRLILVVQ